MSPPTVLVIQLRAANDPMADHERDCIERRIGRDAARLKMRNAVTDPADPSWLDGADAFVIGGSGAFSVHDPRSASWVGPLRHMLDRAIARHTPGFGVCFGHQLLGHHFGATVHTHEDHAEVGTVDVQLTAAGLADPIFGSLEASFPAHTGHSDHVDHVPAGLTLLAENETLNTQAFRVDGHNIYSAQFHPDLSGAEAMARYRALASERPDALENVSLYRSGADASNVLLSRFVQVVAG